MTSDGQSIERLQEYLRKLKPEARAMLVQELERGLLRGDESIANEFVLQELRNAVRAASQPVPRVGDAARMFFVPLEPFLIDDGADHKRIGRIARASLTPIWSWLGRDVMPAEAQALSKDINRALLNDERSKAERLIRTLHEHAVRRMQDTVTAAVADEKARRRLAVQVATPRALEDVTAVLTILTFRDALADLARRLPAHVRSFDRDHVSQFKNYLDTGLQNSIETAPLQKTDFLLYGLIVVMQRLAAPWQLIRIATRAVESDDIARVAETPYAIAVTIVLNEIEWTVSELRAELKAGRPTASLLKRIHDGVRGLCSELDLSVDSAWTRQLAAIRADVSGLLKAEIEVTPGFVRRLLRPRPAKDIAAGSLLDPIDVNEAAMRVEFVDACRHYANELAVNEATMRAHSELTLFLESGTKVLLDSLRQSGNADLPFRQSQVDAAIRLCRTVFGSEYAGLLAKAAEVAVQTTAIERRHAKVGA